MRIGILTYHRSINYGAYLQAYALCRVISERYPSVLVELIDYDMKAADRFYKKQFLRKSLASKSFKGLIYYLHQYKTFADSQSKLKLSSENLYYSNLEEFQKFIRGRYDLIIAGSDEIWRVNGFRGFPSPYWLPGDLQCIKMSYAASARIDYDSLSQKERDLMKNILCDFCYIGVRDESTKRCIDKVMENSLAYINCDPTFLYSYRISEENGRNILINKFGINPGKKTIGFMLEDSEIPRKFMSAYGSKYNYISLYDYHKETRNYARLSPFEWIDVISALDLFVTSRFHGVCFSLKNNVQFIAVEERKTTLDNSKMYDILGRLNLCERYYSSKEMITTEIIKEIERLIQKDTKYNCQPIIELSRSFFEKLDNIVK
ncbi:MAG TPA: polysaccharide pyruvyl transferase family protein [Acetivibrio sp.]|uniref:polysaccharide pyruvyl transferase family protein n=1 Tax=Acetivibrio sp. TaxID=1872092 RepID=UPI002D16A5BD|nr:polysaccharide pyruvyl transferase family protein [Acetivibrio sp.]HOM02593.1 polysaccharide pyruvyl transferase family protein [Acetivibrio sp.]